MEESDEAIKDFNQQIAELQKRREEVIAEINDRWGTSGQRNHRGDHRAEENGCVCQSVWRGMDAALCDHDLARRHSNCLLLALSKVIMSLRELHVSFPKQSISSQTMLLQSCARHALTCGNK